MYLERVRVPDFRVLKDVDITFEKDFIPSIFPIGSQNGGGKSTLLQLIFILLHCSANSERIEFLKNLLSSFKVNNLKEKRVLAIIDIWHDNQTIKLEFFACKDFYIKDLLSGSSLLEEKDINLILKEIAFLRNQEDKLTKEKKDLELDLFSTSSNNKHWQNLEAELKKTTFEKNKLLRHFQDILEQLKSNNIIHIMNYSSQRDEYEEEVLFCQINSSHPIQTESFLKELSNNIFLAAPSTQVFLFLEKEVRNLLFKEETQLSKEAYSYYIKLAKSKLPGIFLYDFLAVDILVNSFKLARDRDFQEKLKTGQYGNYYDSLLNDINYLLGNKQLNLLTDLSGVTFKINKGDEVVELAPEDLSHGELKRLSIYMWLKYRNIENAIVLMDEIEIAFHPDWQYQIVSDLNQWEPSNQYILATHSYELCQALTPAHVKELEPRLMKQSSGQV